MSSPNSSPYSRFIAAALASKPTAEPLEALTVRHQLVENVAGNVYVFGVVPANALADILASKNPPPPEGRA